VPGRLPALLLVFLLSSCTLVNLSFLPAPAPPQERTLEGKGAKKILLLDVSGFISTRSRGSFLGRTDPLTSRVRERLRLAGEDPDLAGLILRIDSPGGTVTASDIVYHEILRFREDRKVPVYAVIVGVGTSGAYYIASAAERILAHPTAVTGSIGVIAVQFNLAGLLEKVGVEGKVIKSVPLKDIYSPLRPDTEQERAILQEMIDALHARFVEVVSKGRSGSIGPEKLRSLADGRPYTARQALDAGLIDGIGYLDDAIEGMKKQLGLDEARVIVYEDPGSRHGSIYASAPGPSASTPGPITVNLLSLDLGALADPPAADFLYLWSP